MARMAYSLEGIRSNQISFNQACIYIIKELTILPWVSPGNIPKVLNEMLLMALALVLPLRSEQSYSRVIKNPPCP